MNHGNSKRLAFLLRHDKNYTLEPGGWREVKDLCHNHLFSEECISEIVKKDDKGRFELNGDKTMVRALYGHSVKIDLQLKEEVPPSCLFHGTALKYIESIKIQGLRRRSRQFVHLTEDRDLAIRTGSRHGDPVLIQVESRNMARNGYSFYRTHNGIWLVSDVPQNYLHILLP